MVDALTDALLARACAWPSPASSPAGPSRTASSISPRPRPWPTWSTPRPRPGAPGAGPARRRGWAPAIRTWREALIEALALLEAAVDFPDEEVPADVAEQARRGPGELWPTSWTAAWPTARAGERVREGYRDRPDRRAQRRQEQPAQRPGRARRGHRHADPGHDARRHRGPAGAGRLQGAAGRHRRPAAHGRADRGRGRAPRAGLGGGRRPAALGGRRAAVEAAWREALELVRAGDICVLNKVDLPSGADGAGAREAARDQGLEVVVMSVLADGAGAVGGGLDRPRAPGSGGRGLPRRDPGPPRDLLREARDHLRRALARPRLAGAGRRGRAPGGPRPGPRSPAGSMRRTCSDRIFATFCIGK